MKMYYYVSALRLSDFPTCVQPFYANAKCKSDSMINIKAALIAIICYGMLALRLRVKYIYNFFISMILLNLLCIGPSGKGKKIVNFIFNFILKYLLIRDNKERDIENDYKRTQKRKATNAKRDEEPPFAYRILQKFTIPIAVKLIDNIRRRYGDILPFILYGDELGWFTENKKGSNEFPAIARTAYNMGEMYSRDSLYEGGYNARVDICWNSIMCGQDSTLAKYINKEGITAGDPSRQIIIRLGEELGEEAPTMKPFDEEQKRCIYDTVNRLMNETFTDDDQLGAIHEVDMSWLDKDVVAYCDQQREIIAKSGSHALDSFYGRASESAFRIAAICYYLFGEDITKRKNVRRIYWYFAQFILNGQMDQWGKQFEAAIPKDKETIIGRPTLYDMMEHRFTRKMLSERIAQLGIKSAARKFLYKWKDNKWIMEVEGEPDTYERLC